MHEAPPEVMHADPCADSRTKSRLKSRIKSRTKSCAKSHAPSCAKSRTERLFYPFRGKLDIAQRRPVSPLSFSALPTEQIHAMQEQTFAVLETLSLYPLTRNLKLNMEGRPTALFSGKLSSGSGYCNMECCCSCSCSLRNAKPHIGIDYRPYTPRLPDNRASRQSPSTVSLTNPR